MWLDSEFPGESGPDLVWCVPHAPAHSMDVLSSDIGVGILTPGWNLDAAGSDEPRSFSVPMVFAAIISSVPVVHLGLTGLDVDLRDSSRVILKAENITPAGFRAVISTWAGSRVFAVEFNWLAIVV